MVCSVGLHAEAACAARRAGIAKFDDLPYYHTGGEQVIGATVPGLSADFENPDRLVELLSRAASDCLRNRPAEPLEKLPLLVGLAEPGRPGGGAGLADSIISRLEHRLKLRFHPRLSRVFPKGHTAGFEALRVARELFQNERTPACLVCGVDSYLTAASLHWLERHWRLKTSFNSDGVIPGEAAAAVLVQPQAPSKGGAGTKITGLGFATEKASVLSEEPLLGLGLAAAARAALGEAGLPAHEISFRISDVTGEQYGFKEQALMVARLVKVHMDSLPIWHCADSIGDTGAAASLCQLVIAFHAFAKGYAPGDRVLGCTSAVPGDRAVLVLQRQT
jgi:3-oxoacyl-[acyl-carrier-protein] synthase-1